MAGYNRGIVATRKLNDNRKAKLGRGNDTKIREVDNRKSHVSALEAYLIDVNGKAGEEYAKRVGAGTVNPLTGMPEYHEPPKDYNFGSNLYEYTAAHDDATHSHPQTVAADQEQSPTDDWSIPNQSYTPEQQVSWDAQNVESISKAPTYEELSGSPGAMMTHLAEFDKSLGTEDLQYFQDIFTDKPFDFLEQEKALSEKGLTSAYEDTVGALGSQAQALGRTTSRGYGQSVAGAQQAAGQSGMATSGTITQGLETQKGQLFEDYTAGMKDIGRERASALDTLTLGQEGATLDLAKGTYGEQQKQMDEFWGMVGMRQQVG